MTVISEEHRRLVDRYIDDLAGETEVAELNALLSARPDVAAYFAEAGRLNCLLREHARETAGAKAAAAAGASVRAAETRQPSRRSRPVSARSRKASRRARHGSERRAATSNRRAAVSSRRVVRRRAGWVAWAAAAAVLICAIGVALHLKSDSAAGPARPWRSKISGLRGRPQIYRGTEQVSAEPGAEVLPGDRILTDDGSLLSLAYDDGTAVDINRGGRLTLGGDRFSKLMTLDSGDLYVSAARQAEGRPIRVNPDRYDQVTVMGTRLEVSLSGRETVLRVAEGRATLGSGERAVAVGAMLFSSVSRGSAPVPAVPLSAEGIAAWRANRPPVAEGAEIAVREGLPAAIVLKAADPDGDHVDFRIERKPEHGDLVGQPPELRYQPRPDYTGPDEFLFSAGDGRARSETARVAVVVAAHNQDPRAVVVVEPAGGRAPLRAIFNGGESSDPDGRIVSYAWDFGDGSHGDGIETAHVYRKPGSYRAKLTVRDEKGGSAEAVRTVKVVDPDFVAAPTRFRWHYHKTKGSYWSWQDNSEGEGSFEIERAHDPTGRGGPDLKWQVIEETPANTTLKKIRYAGEKSGDFYRYRVRAVGRGKRSEPSNEQRQKWGDEGPKKDQVNWPPPGYVEK